VISETEFARRYTSTWRMLTPMTEDFVRHVNGSWCVERFAPLRSRKVRRERHAIINEVAFRAFVLGLGAKATDQSNPISPSRLLNAAISELSDDQLWARKASPLDQDEHIQANELRQRLTIFFDNKDSGDLVLFPKFRGCGLLDECAGDVLVGNTLYEVKAGGRFFRSIDLRQLLIYSMLSWRGGDYSIKRLGMFNPRIGIYYEEELGEICQEVSGTSSNELFAEISQVVSGSDFSR
jgi:hypothetical protein